MLRNVRNYVKKMKKRFILIFLFLLLIITLFFPIFPNYGPIGWLPNTFDNLKNSYYNSGLFWALKRALIVEKIDYAHSPYWRNSKDIPSWNVPWCAPEKLKRKPEGAFRNCRVIRGASEKDCHSNFPWTFINQYCQSFKISKQIWEFENNRDTIRHAVVNQCQYLYDPKTKELERVFLQYKNSRYGARSVGKNLENGDIAILVYPGSNSPWDLSNCTKHYRVDFTPFGGSQFPIPFLSPRDKKRIVYIEIEDAPDGKTLKDSVPQYYKLNGRKIT